MTPLRGLSGFIDSQRDRLAAAFDSVMAGEAAEPVHRFRVASRRLREPLNVAEGIGVGSTRAAGKLLRRGRNALRRVRDLDVFATAVTEDVQAGRLSPSVGEPLLAIVARERMRGAAKARKNFERIDRARLVKKLKRIGAKVSAGDAACGAKAVGLIEQEMHDRVDALVSHVRDAGADVDWHRVRLKLKRVRYLAELLGDVRGGVSPELLAGFKSMQTVLGGYADDVFAATYTARLSASAHGMEEDVSFGAGLLGYASWRANRAASSAAAAQAQWPSFLAHLDAARRVARRCSADSAQASPS